MSLSKINVRPLDAKSNIYATIDERGYIIGTGTREVCEFLMWLANKELQGTSKARPLSRTNQATIRSAIEI